MLTGETLLPGTRGGEGNLQDLPRRPAGAELNAAASAQRNAASTVPGDRADSSASHLVRDGRRFPSVWECLAGDVKNGVETARRRRPDSARRAMVRRARACRRMWRGGLILASPPEGCRRASQPLDRSSCRSARTRSSSAPAGSSSRPSRRASSASVGTSSPWNAFARTAGCASGIHPPEGGGSPGCSFHREGGETTLQFT